MSLKKIIESANEKNVLALKEAFEEEMASRVAAVLEEKYKKACKEEDEVEDDDEDEDEVEDDDEDDDDEDEVKEKYKK